MFRISKLSALLFICSSFIALSIITLSGCATGNKETFPVNIDEDIAYEANNAPEEPYEGSLWKDNGSLCELFIDPKARRVGDIVTISVVETSSASNAADTNTSRNSSISASITSLLGLENNASFPTGSGFDPFGSIEASASNTFKGSGVTNRSGNLAASITARVTDVLPNGNLKILGKREITINKEKQYITLTGIIRPNDISSDNIILSTYISDAKIAYTGTGVVNDRQNPGWLATVFDVVWPF
jgi:flagellar L-ring protein precursor FlgH